MFCLGFLRSTVTYSKSRGRFKRYFLPICVTLLLNLVQRRSTILLVSVSKDNTTSSTSKESSDLQLLLRVFTKGLLPNGLRLLVAVSGILTADHYKQLSAFLWRNGLDATNPDIQAPVRLKYSNLSSVLTYLSMTVDFPQHAMCRENYKRVFASCER